MVDELKAYCLRIDYTGKEKFEAWGFKGIQVMPFYGDLTAFLTKEDAHDICNKVNGYNSAIEENTKLKAEVERLSHISDDMVGRAAEVIWNCLIEDIIDKEDCRNLAKAALTAALKGE